MSNDAPIEDYPVRPDGCLDLLYSPDQGLRVVGAMTTERRYDLPGGGFSAGIRFRPGMAGALLGISPAEFTDQLVPASEIFGCNESEERLGVARSAFECMRIMMSAVRMPPEAPNGVQQAIEAMTAANGSIDLDWVAGQANLSERQFRRRCLEESGLAPKHLCRVLRFRHALQLAGAVCRPEWAGIAAEAGYFDQAHLIRDFREFTGDTPMAVFSNPPSAEAAMIGA